MKEEKIVSQKSKPVAAIVAGFYEISNYMLRCHPLIWHRVKKAGSDNLLLREKFLSNSYKNCVV